MRIIGKHRDYYDCGLAQGIDDEIVYVRKHEVVPPHTWHDRSGEKRWRNPWWKPSKDASFGYVGFCGKLYPVARYWLSPSQGKVVGDSKFYYAYTAEELVEFRERREKQTGLSVWRSDWLLDAELEAFRAGPAEHVDLFREHNVPVLFAEAAVNEDCFREMNSPIRASALNPVLGDVQFTRIFDAYTAFQEISMFLGGVLGWPGNAMAEVPDEHRFTGHGYDEQSFRAVAGRKTRKGKRKKKA